jgi:DNA repair protein RecN (Recombination protein N)
MGRASADGSIMLNHIFVKDLAIVSRLELDLHAGMTALTGETGAGKSILIDALGLALGDKPDAGMIRSGCDRAEVVASFDLSRCPQARQWLAEQQLDDADDCLVRRLLARAGRSRAYVNGHPATGAQLQALGEQLVDIHGQHAHQSLLRTSAQRALVDAYGGHANVAAEVAARYRQYRSLDERLRHLQERSKDRTDRIDHLRFQVEELESLGLGAGEIDDLDREQRRLANLERLQTVSGRLLDRLYDAEASTHAGLSRALSDLEELCAFDERLRETHLLVEGAAIQVEEAAANLRQYIDELELDPGLADHVETRLAQIHDLARKYRVLPLQIPSTLDGLRADLTALENDDLAVGELAQELDIARESFLALAQQLSDRRRTAAARLSDSVTESMQQLGMGGGQFAVQVTRTDAADAGSFGLDLVELMVTANPGQPLRPLSKVASGGELSRIGLCIHVAAAECAGIPTLIFDEVDVGIGGGIAEIVGRLLRTLGATRQVLCVTHLPQVASQAHHHLQVRKYTHAGETFTGINALAEDQRVDEIARMLGGMEITEKTLDHAREMRGRAQVGDGSPTRP